MMKELIDPKKYVAYGPWFSGGFDTLEEANGLLQQYQGAIYVRLDYLEHFSVAAEKVLDWYSRGADYKELVAIQNLADATEIYEKM